MLSADVTPEAKREALEAGFDAFLPKPIEAVRLLDEVQALSLGKPEVRGVDFPVAARAPSTEMPAPVINRETLGHLRQLSANAAFVENLVGVFLADSDALLGRVEQALAARNYKEFRSLLHAMKGSSASIGTERLTALCGSHGSLSDAEMRLQGPALLRSLGDQLATTRAELERYVRESRQSTA